MGRLDALLSVMLDKPNPVLVAATILLLILDTVLSGLNARSALMSKAELLGAALVPALVVAVVIAVARAFSKGRSRKAKVQLAFWTLLVLAISNLSNLVSRSHTQS